MASMCFVLCSLQSPFFAVILATHESNFHIQENRTNQSINQSIYNWQEYLEKQQLSFAIKLDRSSNIILIKNKPDEILKGLLLHLLTYVTFQMKKVTYVESTLIHMVCSPWYFFY